MLARIYFVELTVSDWQRSLSWYIKVFNFPILMQRKEDRFALLDCGGVRLALKEGIANPGSMVLTLLVEDIDALRAHMVRMGVALHSDIKQSEEGYRRLRLRDPDGYLLSLFAWTPPGRPDFDNPPANPC